MLDPQYYYIAKLDYAQYNVLTRQKSVKREITDAITQFSNSNNFHFNNLWRYNPDHIATDRHTELIYTCVLNKVCLTMVITDKLDIIIDD